MFGTQARGSRPKVAVTSPLVGRALEILRARAKVRVHDGPALVRPEEVADFVGMADAAVTLLANPVTEEVLERCTNLKVVANCAVGYDNIELAAAERHGVWVTNTPDVLTAATADLTWALILAVTRRLREAEDYLRAGRYEGWALDLLLGAGLQGRTLGIVGLGRIGKAVAERAAAFGMKVVYADHSPKSVDLERLELGELVAAADITSIHCPSSPETRHLFDRRLLRSMRPGAVLINTARGALVHEEALVEALRDGPLGGAGLDVFENEPEVHLGLFELPNVVLLPHVGSATVETRSAMAELAAENAVAVLAGIAPPTPIVRPPTSRS
jgi:glyoxylate reductase